jgi:hypothetical protein
MRLMAGSQGIAALSRSVFMVCLDLESIDHRILIPVKGNLVVSPPPQRFHLVQDKAWVHTLDSMGRCGGRGDIRDVDGAFPGQGW